MTNKLKKNAIQSKINQAFHGTSEVVAIYLYGSVATGKSGPLSDIDLGFLLEGSISPDEYFRKRLQLIAQCQNLLEFSPVEVMVLNNSPLVLGHRIIFSGTLITENDHDQLVKFETELLSRYFDFRPMLNVHNTYLKKHILEEAPVG